MRIWILTSETPDYVVGGIGRYVDNLARGLGRDGHDVRVISRGEHPGERQVAPGYVLQVFRENLHRPVDPAIDYAPREHPHFPYNVLDYWTALSYQYAEELDKTVEKVGLPDVIESQDYGAISYYAQQRQLLDADYLQGVPFVLHLHGPDFILQRSNHEPRYILPQYWHGRMIMANLVAADAVISPSHYLADEMALKLADHGVTIERIPLPWTAVEPTGTNPKLDPARVLYIGRLEYRKGIVELLQACERLWSDGEQFTLELAGGDTEFVPRGEMMSSFIQRRYEARIASGQLVLLGSLPQPELFKVIRSVGTVVIPSNWENFPNTCIEGMMLEKVMVVSRHGGQAEMVGDDGQCGFCFDWNIPGDCQSKLRRALALSDAQRQEIGKRAHNRIAEMCKPENVLPTRLRHFENVISGRRERSLFPFVNPRQARGEVNASIPAVQCEPGRVSVVIPFYNLAQYVGETLQSIAASDYPDIETILVDDGSTDSASVALLESYAGSPPVQQFRIVRRENGGLATARNTGAEAATGEYIVFLDADDLLEPTFISRAVSICKRFSNVHIVYSWEQYFHENNDIWPTWNLELPFLLAKNQAPARAFVRRDAFLAFGQNKPRMLYNFEDFDAWVSMVIAGCGGVSIPECLVRYRMRNDSLWQTSNRRQQLYLHELMLEHHEAVYREYGAELFGLLNANGSAQRWSHPGCLNPVDADEAWKREYVQRIQRDWVAINAQLQQRDASIKYLQTDLEWHKNDAQHFKDYCEKLNEEIEWRKGCMERLEAELMRMKQTTP